MRQIRRLCKEVLLFFLRIGATGDIRRKGLEVDVATNVRVQQSAWDLRTEATWKQHPICKFSFYTRMKMHETEHGTKWDMIRHDRLKKLPCHFSKRKAITFHLGLNSTRRTCIRACKASVASSIHCSCWSSFALRMPQEQQNSDSG